MSRLTTYFIVFLCSLGFLNAQVQKGSKVEISLYAFDYVKGLETVYLQDHMGESQEIRLSKANVLGPFKTWADDSSRVQICRKSVESDGTITYPVIASIKVEKAKAAPLFVLFPTKKGTYHGLVIDRSASEFPVGSYKLLNASPFDIRGLVGESKVVAKQRKLTSLQPSFNGYDPISVHFQYKQSDEWKTLGRTRWVKQKTKQTLLCAYIDPRSKRVKMRGLALRPLR